MAKKVKVSKKREKAEAPERRENESDEEYQRRVDDFETNQGESVEDLSPEDLMEDEFGDEENDEQVLAESRPKTGVDQRRVLKVRTNPEHDAIIGEAKERLEGKEIDEMDDEEYEKYIEEEYTRLKHYGSVKLTPKTKNLVRVPLHKARLAKGGDMKESDLVKVTMLETIDPAPTVGKINVVNEFAYERLVKGETYLLPMNVAAILAEGRKGAVHD